MYLSRHSRTKNISIEQTHRRDCNRVHVELRCLLWTCYPFLEWNCWQLNVYADYESNVLRLHYSRWATRNSITSTKTFLWKRSKLWGLLGNTKSSQEHNRCQIQSDFGTFRAGKITLRQILPNFQVGWIEVLLGKLKGNCLIRNIFFVCNELIVVVTFFLAVECYKDRVNEGIVDCSVSILDGIIGNCPFIFCISVLRNSYFFY